MHVQLLGQVLLANSGAVPKHAQNACMLGMKVQRGQDCGLWRTQLPLHAPPSFRHADSDDSLPGLSMAHYCEFLSVLPLEEGLCSNPGFASLIRGFARRRLA